MDIPLTAPFFWDGAAYLAFFFIILAIYREQFVNGTLAVCAVVLGVYAWFFLEISLLATLQGLIFASASLQWAKVPRRRGIIIMGVLTFAAYAWLVFNGDLTDIKALLGSFGLLGIAGGLMLLPLRLAFLVMAIGGTLLVFYSYPDAMVFVLLNGVFVIVNIKNYWKNRAAVKSTQ